MRHISPALRRLLQWPLWLLSPFGSAHDFHRNPVIGSALLNRLGLHVLRLLVSQALSAWRRLWLRHLLPREQWIAFHRDGFIVIRDLLPAEQFAELRQEVLAARGEVRECVQGDTLTHRLLLDEDTLAALPALRALSASPRFAGALRYVAARNAHPLLYVQSIRNGVREGAADPQKVLHSDTFHPTMKAWYFLEDVTADGGPFTYVPGSHRLDGRRLRWEYRRSCIAATLRDGYSEKGSFRFSEDDLDALGLGAPRAFALPANTLVVADTRGIHCRGPARPGARRLEIWAYSRLNPFNPLPGFNSRRWARAFTTALRWKWRRLDELAARRGELSSWHPVAPETLHAEKV